MTEAVVLLMVFRMLKVCFKEGKLGEIVEEGEIVKEGEVWE